MGNYVRGSLVSGEQVVYETKLHWIIFVSLKALFTLFIAPLIAVSTSEFAITNKRIIIKVGLISRRTLEMNLSKIESVNVSQSLFGRMLGYGTILVIGTGGTKEPFACITDPMTFRKKFQELGSMDAAEPTPQKYTLPTSPTPPSPPSPPLQRMYLHIANEVKGPYTCDQVRALLDIGTVSSDTQACQEGTESWQQISSFLT